MNKRPTRMRPTLPLLVLLLLSVLLLLLLPCGSTVVTAVDPSVPYQEQDLWYNSDANIAAEPSWHQQQEQPQQATTPTAFAHCMSFCCLEISSLRRESSVTHRMCVVSGSDGTADGGHPHLSAPHPGGSCGAALLRVTLGAAGVCGNERPRRGRAGGATGVGGRQSDTGPLSGRAVGDAAQQPEQPVCRVARYPHRGGSVRHAALQRNSCCCGALTCGGGGGDGRQRGIVGI